MKKIYLLLSFCALLSLAAYIYLQTEQRAILDAQQPETETMAPEVPATGAAQPDILLIKAVVKHVVRLLPAS